MNAQPGSLLSDNAEWIVSTIKRNPEGLLLLAAGAALLLRTGSASSSADRSMTAAYEQGYGTSRPSTGDAIRQATEAVSDVARQTAETAASYTSAASEYASRARRAASDQSDRIARQTQSMTRSIIQDQPLTIVAAGIAAGALVAAVFPPTEWEKDALGPIGEEVSKAAGKIGDQLKDATSKAGDTLKTAAEKRGLNPEGLKEVADEVVGTFKESLKGEPTGYAESQSSRGPQYSPGSR